jgi:transposase-like protein
VWPYEVVVGSEAFQELLGWQVSDTWRADELYLKVKGNMKYPFAMMDDETRFWTSTLLILSLTPYLMKTLD